MLAAQNREQTTHYYNSVYTHAKTPNVIYYLTDITMHKNFLGGHVHKHTQACDSKSISFIIIALVLVTIALVFVTLIVRILTHVLAFLIHLYVQIAGEEPDIDNVALLPSKSVRHAPNRCLCIKLTFRMRLKGTSGAGANANVQA